MNLKKTKRSNMDNSIIPIIRELERVYTLLAKKFQLNSVKPIITIQSKGRQKTTLGWYWEKKWQHNKKEVGEINICAESLNKNPIETLVHEMAHYSNSCEDIKDCNAHQYHNKNFKTKAESYGLNVEKDGRHGWSLTTISSTLKAILKEIKVDYKVFKIYRKLNLSVVAPTKMKKYSCGCTTVRCATKLEAKCLICNKEFEERG
jgi:hypothetical protein